MLIIGNYDWYSESIVEHRTNLLDEHVNHVMIIVIHLLPHTNEGIIS